MSETRIMFTALIGVGLAVYSLIAIVPLVFGLGWTLAGGDIAFPLLITWCVLNWRGLNL